jgi:ribosomal protein S12 methylthiotransferase
MLRRMRRGHGGPRLRRVVETLRTKVPGLTFRTAFIVGHPGETDAEFEELCEFVRWARFERVGVFRYSDEEDSKSHELDGKVPARTAASRHTKLMKIQRAIALAHTKSLVGQELEVLVEGPSEEHELVMQGRHAGQAPEIDGQVYLSGGEALPGQIRLVTITQASHYDLVGELADDGAAVPAAPAARKRAERRVSLRVVAADGRAAR